MSKVGTYGKIKVLLRELPKTVYVCEDFLSLWFRVLQIILDASIEVCD